MEREIHRPDLAHPQALSFDLNTQTREQADNIVFFPGLKPETSASAGFEGEGFLGMSLDNFMAEINSMIDTATVDVSFVKPLQQGEEGNIFIASDYDDIEKAYQKLEKQNPNVLNMIMDRVSTEAMRMQAACSHDHSKGDSDIFSSMVDTLFEKESNCGGCGGEMKDGKCTKCKKSPSLFKKEEIKLAA